MRRLFTQTFAMIVLGAAGLVLAGCFTSKSEWKSKIIVAVETPDGIITGSSVRRETAVFTDGPLVPPEARGGKGGRSGEAVVVNLGNGKYLFALLPGPDSEQVFFPDEAPEETAPKMAGLVGKGRVLSPKNYPLLVTFTDIADPKTVAKVDPANLAASFGVGYALKSITLEITDEPVTDGVVEGVLGWIRQYYDKMLDGRNLRWANSDVFANSLSQVDFLRE